MTNPLEEQVLLSTASPSLSSKLEDTEARVSFDVKQPTYIHDCAQQSTDTFGRISGRASVPSTPTSLKSRSIYTPSLSSRTSRKDNRSNCSDEEEEEEETEELQSSIPAQRSTIMARRNSSTRDDISGLNQLPRKKQSDWSLSDNQYSPKRVTPINGSLRVRQPSFLDTYEDDHYRRAGLCSDLTDWAPSAKPPKEQWAGIRHLPDWDSIKSGQLTSQQNGSVQSELEWSVQKLLTEKVFETLIKTSVGRRTFRNYLTEHCTPGAQQRLDMYFDLSQYVRQNHAICSASQDFYENYLAQDNAERVSLPQGMADNFYILLKKQSEMQASVGPMQQHLLQSLYRTEFQLFVKAQFIQHYKVKLGHLNNSEEDFEQTGLGDCYCLTNPRLRENPIILVSPGFEKITGYPRHQIIGRNCRFLQGPGTSPQSVQRIRNALNKGESSTELLVNYRLDGTPFFCLLTIIPIRDSSGAVVYFIGGQTNVSGQFMGSKGLQFLGEEVSSRESSKKAEGSQFLTHYGRSNSSTSADSRSDGQSTGSSSIHSDSSSRSDGNKRAAKGEETTSQALGRNVFAPESFSVSAQESGDNARYGMSRLFRLPSNKREIPSLIQTQKGVAGIEGAMRKEAHSIDEQIDYYTSLYSKLIIFMRTKREIIFATQDCLDFYELPVENPEQIYASPLVHADFLSILQGATKEETKRVQKAVGSAVEKGESISIRTGIKQVGTTAKKRTITSSWLAAKDKLKYTVLHITPLRDRDESDFAFVAVMS
jgi:PAS domain S-box-containing protein